MSCHLSFTPLFFTNSHIGSTTGTTTITAGDTTNIIGGQVIGEKVTLNTTNLNIESLQDTATYDSKQKDVSGSITIGPGFSASGSFSKSNIDADYASVNEQSGIIAGNGGYNINVANDTSLIGGIITSTQQAEDNGLNSFSTGTLIASNIDNFSRYEGDSFGISGGVSYSYPNPETQTSATTTTKTPTAGQEEGQWGVSKSIGYGSDSDSQTSTTYSGINTSNITITGNGNTDTPAVIPAEAGIQTDDNGMKTITAANLADIFTSTTTDTITENSGSLANTFDAEAVQKELDVQTRVTQTFDTNRQEVKAEINSIIDEANRALEADPTNKEAQQTLQDMQRLGVLVDSIAGALYSPADNALGTVANTLSPAIVYEIGQYFKENEELNKLDNGNRPEEGSAAHILAQTLVAAATASLAGNDELTAGLSAGGAEILAPVLAEWMYDKDPKELTSEEKNTISAIISLGSATIGATTGNTTDVVSSSVAGTVAVEDNKLTFVEAKAMIAEKEQEINFLSSRVTNGIATKEDLERISELAKELGDFYKEFGYTDAEIEKNLEIFNEKVDKDNTFLTMTGLALLDGGLALKEGFEWLATRSLVLDDVSLGVAGGEARIVESIISRDLSHINAGGRFEKIGINEDLLSKQIFSLFNKYETKLKNGNNLIVTKINGQDVSIKIFMDNGIPKSVNAYPGISGRATTNTIMD